eukprot:9059109-Alexandrium_andersonii.AAC.2
MASPQLSLEEPLGVDGSTSGVYTALAAAVSLCGVCLCQRVKPAMAHPCHPSCIALPQPTCLK